MSATDASNWAARSSWYTVQQPIVFPPIYIMERFARCHDVVVLDQAQFDRDNAQFTLMSGSGPLPQTLALEQGDFRLAFNQRIVADPSYWAAKFLRTAQIVYGRQAHYQRLAPWLRDTVASMVAERRLEWFCMLSVESLARLLGMEFRQHVGSVMLPERPQGATAWVAAFCNQLHATDYVQGARSMRAYFLKGPFEDARCRTWGQAFELSYTSNAGRTGHAGLSILDLLFTQGVEQTRLLLGIDKGPGDVGTTVLVER